MPKLWTETIETHRREVRYAISETTAALVAEHALLGVTMSQIAERTGIGRATLYKYFTDVESILLAWHDRQIEGHLAYLAQVRDGADGAESSEPCSRPMRCFLAIRGAMMTQVLRPCSIEMSGSLVFSGTSTS